MQTEKNGPVRKDGIQPEIRKRSIRPDYNKESQGNKSNYTALLYIERKKK